MGSVVFGLKKVEKHCSSRTLGQINNAEISETYSLLSLHPDSEEFDGSGAQVTRSGIGEVAGHRVQNGPQQHAVLKHRSQL